MTSEERSELIRDYPTAHQVAVLALFGLPALAILVTYARLPAADTYNVSKSGLEGGLSRTLLFTNFPFAFAAVSLIGIAVLRVRRVIAAESRTLLTAVAFAGVLLCVFTALPGVVDQDDLDAKPVNLIPALGGLIAIVLTGLSIRLDHRPYRLPWTGRDHVGLALIGVLALISLPWFVGELGFYIDDIPVIGRIFMASEIPPGEPLTAVHLGHHHGFDGFLFVTTSLILGRLVRSDTGTRLAGVLRAYLALMFAYGAANLVNDAWLEQIVKRGSADYRLPSFLRPELSFGWTIMLAGAVVAWTLLFRPTNTVHHHAEADVPEEARAREAALGLDGGGHGAKATSGRRRGHPR